MQKKTKESLSKFVSNYKSDCGTEVMITGELKSQIDRIWDAFWSGGIANPLEVMEQITYLLFIKRLDDLHTVQEKKANRLGRPIERTHLPGGQNRKRAFPTRICAGPASSTSTRRPCSRRWARASFPSSATCKASAKIPPMRATCGTRGSPFPTPALLATRGGHAGPRPDGRPGHQRRCVRVHAR